MKDRWKNKGGEAVDFSKQAYLDRQHKLMRLASAEGVDAVWLTSEAEIAYFCGFRSPFWQSPTRPWSLLMAMPGVLHGSGLPIAVVPTIGEVPLNRCRDYGVLGDVRTWSSPHPTDDGVSLLIDALRPCGRIGVMKGAESYLRFPLQDYEKLQAALPDATFVDITPHLRACRSVKSEAEIDLIRRACQIGSAAFDQVPKLAREGMAIDQAFRLFKQEVLAQGADDVPFVVGGAGQGGYGDIISPPTSAALAEGDVFMMDLGATHKGYFCDFDRNFAVGHISTEAQDAYQKLYEATEAALEIARPGKSCADLFAVMDKILNPNAKAEGGVGRYGHGLGLQLTEFPSLIGHDHTELLDGMVLTIEPSISYGDGLSMVTEENIVVRNGEPEILTTRAPQVMQALG